MEALFILLPAVLGASIASALFAYGAVLLVRNSLRGRVRIPGYHKPKKSLSLARALGNPLLRPRDEAWEAEGVLNPAAVRHQGLTHLFYRAIGNDGVSRIGHATVTGGAAVDERSSYPVFGLPNESKDAYQETRESLHPELIASGGSWSGAEDPRAVIIDDRVYLSFSAFNGWDSVRVGVSSISTKDLERRRWQWTKPVYLSAPKEVHKNWVLFPEKVRGSFAVLQSPYGQSNDRVLVASVDSLTEDPKEYLKCPYERKADHASAWKHTARGVGPPPLRTSAGWLVFYHATEATVPHEYQLGALLLDLDDPSRVIARSNAAVLTPEARYENEGAKPGIVYACGAVTEDDTLTVYYGAADSVVCAAAASLSTFVRTLLEGGRPSLTPAIA